MAKKQPTEKQLAARKAFGEAAKARAAAKKAEKLSEAQAEVAAPPAPEQTPAPEQPVQAPAPGVTLTQEQFQMMLDRLAARPEPQASPEVVQQQFGGQAPSLNTQGGVVGVIERFPIDPKHYKNPVEDLYDLPELRKNAMRENFVIEWTVTPAKYQTAMGTWYIEPRFELTLKKKQWDDDGNELIKYKPNGEAYHPRLVIGRASFFNDPPADIMEAEQAGLTLENVETPEGQEAMRMYRYKFWLLERMNPRKPQFTTNNRREEVIGGKAYEIDEYSMPV